METLTQETQEIFLDSQEPISWEEAEKQAKKKLGLAEVVEVE